MWRETPESLWKMFLNLSNSNFFCRCLSFLILVTCLVAFEPKLSSEAVSWTSNWTKSDTGAQIITSSTLAGRFAILAEVGPGFRIWWMVAMKEMAALLPRFSFRSWPRRCPPRCWDLARHPAGLPLLHWQHLSGKYCQAWQPVDLLEQFLMLLYFFHTESRIHFWQLHYSTLILVQENRLARISALMAIFCWRKKSWLFSYSTFKSNSVPPTASRVFPKFSPFLNHPPPPRWQDKRH